MVTRNAQTQATAPASTAVKTPARMPPRMMKRVIMPQNAETAMPKAARGGTGSPVG